jgi:hypothetical protein
VFVGFVVSKTAIIVTVRHKGRLVQSLARFSSLMCGPEKEQVGGNIVSMVIPSEGNATELATIRSKAVLFGLHTSCSERVVTEGGESQGSLEMYCCVPRGPTASERQLIDRSKGLIALAIKLGNGPIHQGSNESPTLGQTQLRGMDEAQINSWQVN